VVLIFISTMVRYVNLNEMENMKANKLAKEG